MSQTNETNNEQPTPQKVVDSNKEAADLNCSLKISKCLTSGAKTAEEVEKAIQCLKEQGQSATV